jgi:hypothetical protein
VFLTKSFLSVSLLPLIPLIHCPRPAWKQGLQCGALLLSVLFPKPVFADDNSMLPSWNSTPLPSSLLSTPPLQNSLDSTLLADSEEEVILPLGKPAVVAANQTTPQIDSAVRESQPDHQTVTTPPQRTFGPLTLRKATRVRWSPSTNALHAEGGVEVVYADPKDGKVTTLTAQAIDYETNVVTAQGSVRMTREEGVFTGEKIVYHFQNRALEVTEATVATENFRISGKSVTTQPDGSYVVIDGVFTTCANERPDYRIKARRLTIMPNRSVSARYITFYAGRTPLITIPSYKRDLSSSASVPIPKPGYNKRDGFMIRYQSQPISTPHQTLDLDLRPNFRRFPGGVLLYQKDLAWSSKLTVQPTGIQPSLYDPLRGLLEQFSPPTYLEYVESRFDQRYPRRTTFFATLQNEQYVYNRRRTDLGLARYPEVGIRFANLLEHSPSSKSPLSDSSTQVDDNVPDVRKRFVNTPALLDVISSFGVIREQPTNVTAERLALRADLASQPLLFGRRLSFRVGISDWFNLYSSGTAYNILSPEVELDYIPTRTSVFNVGYRVLSDKGTTPFAFDRRDVRQEMHMQYQVGGPWAFSYLTRYDVERARFYDAEISVLRNLDCIQCGVAYRRRSQQFAIIFNLLPPSRSRLNRRAMSQKPL